MSDTREKYFDGLVYAAFYPDVMNAVIDGRVKSAYKHYKKFGAHENRFVPLNDTGRVDGNLHEIIKCYFNGLEYLELYPDVRVNVMSSNIESARVHYLKYGRSEQRRFTRTSADSACAGTAAEYLQSVFGKLDSLAIGRGAMVPGGTKVQVAARLDTLIREKEQVLTGLAGQGGMDTGIKRIYLQQVHDTIRKVIPRTARYYDCAFNEAKNYQSLFISRYEDKPTARGTGPVFHWGGPVFPDPEAEIIGRHARSYLFPYDDDAVSIARPQNPEVLSGTSFFWCGPVIRHFGHFIADYCSRILGSSLHAEPGELLFYMKEPGTTGHPELVGWQKFLVNYLNPAGKDIRLVNSSVVCNSLYICPQSEPLNGYPRIDYLDALSAIQPRRKVRKEQVVYVSRTRLETGERLAGEHYLEECLSRAGVKIFHPQDHPVDVQLDTYLTAGKLIFTEGSALHLLQLLGWNALEHVIIIPKGYFRRPHATHLTPRCKTLTYLDTPGEIRGPGSAGSLLPSTVYRRFFTDLGNLVRQLDGLAVPVGKYFEPRTAGQRLAEEERVWLELLKSRFGNAVEIAGIRFDR